jgi:hypothetical protein
VNAATELPLRQPGEPALHQIEPRRASGRGSGSFESLKLSLRCG